MPDEQCRTVPRRFYDHVPASTSATQLFSPGGTLDAAGNLYRVNASDPQSAVQVRYNTNGWTLPYAADANALGTCVGADHVTGMVNNVYASVDFDNPAQMADYMQLVWQHQCGATQPVNVAGVNTYYTCYCYIPHYQLASPPPATPLPCDDYACTGGFTSATHALAYCEETQPTELVECPDQEQFESKGVTMYGRDCRRVAAAMYPDTLARDPSFAHAPHPADRVMDNAAGEEAIYYTPRYPDAYFDDGTRPAWRATTARTTTAS